MVSEADYADGVKHTLAAIEGLTIYGLTPKWIGTRQYGYGGRVPSQQSLGKSPFKVLLRHLGQDGSRLDVVTQYSIHDLAQVVRCFLDEFFSDRALNNESINAEERGQIASMWTENHCEFDRAHVYPYFDAIDRGDMEVVESTILIDKVAIDFSMLALQSDWAAYSELFGQFVGVRSYGFTFSEVELVAIEEFSSYFEYWHDL